MSIFDLLQFYSAGIEGAFSEAGSKTVIPRKVIGKFSLRLVPNQSPDKIKKLVTEHLQRTFQERKSPNKLRYILYY